MVEAIAEDRPLGRDVVNGVIVYPFFSARHVPTDGFDGGEVGGTRRRGPGRWRDDRQREVPCEQEGVETRIAFTPSVRLATPATLDYVTLGVVLA